MSNTMITNAPSNKFYFPFIDLSNEQLVEYTPDNWNSLFIPALPPGFVDEDLLIYVIEEIFIIGNVKRVDIIKKENSNNRHMAFIHFDYWYKNNSIDIFREKLEKDGQIDVFGFINKNNLFTDYCDFISCMKKGLFIRFMINKTPIKDTELNIHQIADLLEKADKKITEQDLLIEKLKRDLQEAQEQLNLVKNNSLHENLHFIDFENISDIEDLDEYLYNKELDKPKLIHELYIKKEDYDNISMTAFHNKFEKSSYY